MEIFKLKEDEEYIELNNLLKALNWVASGGEAKAIIKEGSVIVNGEVETRVRKKMRCGDTVKLQNDEAKVE
ncbi:RNA-binding S4 domain-containing protein [Fulvivirga lutimaris]|uniref:RNA-binding S4 domain-containing protein n=1 Tax=Fulvivirga lutimaris TaxID=1819566 RepID=UPI0012BB704B|nr:RNA-binding S4 domain-containing protein [Fulvivirga lutimaris]MTI38370.1 RNA-binding S4 domain-containing protein [Fulvivirga lutimaris]